MQDESGAIYLIQLLRLANAGGGMDDSRDVRPIALRPFQASA